MISSHANSTSRIDKEIWQPIRVPRRGQDRTAFHAFVLLPGLSVSFLASVLGRSRSSISAYRRTAADTAVSDSRIFEAVAAAVSGMQAEHGLQMARLRGSSQLPGWSRLAIREFYKQGWTRKRIAKEFLCSISTVNNVIQGKNSAYQPLSQNRILTKHQQNPPNKLKKCG